MSVQAERSVFLCTCPHDARFTLADPTLRLCPDAVGSANMGYHWPLIRGILDNDHVMCNKVYFGIEVIHWFAVFELSGELTRLHSSLSFTMEEESNNFKYLFLPR